MLLNAELQNYHFLLPSIWIKVVFWPRAAIFICWSVKRSSKTKRFVPFSTITVPTVIFHRKLSFTVITFILCSFYYLFLPLRIGNHEQKTMQGSRKTAEPNMSSHVTFWKILYLIKIKHKNDLKDCSEPYDPPDLMQIGREESGIL